MEIIIEMIKGYLSWYPCIKYSEQGWWQKGNKKTRKALYINIQLVDIISFGTWGPAYCKLAVVNKEGGQVKLRLWQDKY